MLNKTKQTKKDKYTTKLLNCKRFILKRNAKVLVLISKRLKRYSFFKLHGCT